MGKAGGNLPRRATSRLRNQATQSGEPPSSCRALVPEAAEPPHASIRAVAGESTTLAHAAVRAVKQAAEACEGMEVEPGVSMNEALLDPVHRAQAARWRSGPEHRKVAAILARMMQALHGIRPAWISSPGSQNPPVAEPLPVRRAPTPGSHGLLPAGVKWCLQKIRALSYGWKTWCLIMLLLIFPKVLASMLTLIVRLCVRAGFALVARLMNEVGREMHGLVLHMTQASNMLEEWVLLTLEGLISPPAPQQVPVPLSSSSSPTSSFQVHGEGACGTCPPPCPPWNFLTAALVVVDLALHRRHRGGAG